jgi:hypothetical protein
MCPKVFITVHSLAFIWPLGKVMSGIKIRKERRGRIQTEKKQKRKEGNDRGWF